MQVRVVPGLDSVAATAWDALVGDGSPFLEHAFLDGLIRTGCATESTGWAPRIVLVTGDDNRLLAAAPAWRKTHSMGEFVYDHGWAQGAQRAGYRYYPKLVVGVPFTPVTGQRLLVHPDAPPEARERLIDGLFELTRREAQGLHVLFDTAAETSAFEARGAFTRLQYQFWWKNEGYTSWEHFLERFPSKDRNKLRRERREARAFEIADEVAPDDATIDALYDFYGRTCDRFHWGHRYLDRSFFRHLGATWRHRIHAVVVREGGQPIAGTLNVRKGDRLYGRYWGTRPDRELPFLHFEVCYHRAIEYAIAEKIAVFEPGHGGEHKYRRGFQPQLTFSSHWFPDKRLHDAFARYTAEEAAAVHQQVDALTEEGKLRPVLPGPT